MYFLDKSNTFEYSEWLKTAESEGAAVLIDKEKNWTSFDVVAKLRSLTKIKKIGHAGTLDPLATGLLIVCLSKATKEIYRFQDLGKAYIGIIRLGATTKTDDSEAEEENILPYEYISVDKIKEVVESFSGEILQCPPKYSAKKVGGKRMYRLARENKPIEVKPVGVNIYRLEITNIDLPLINIEVECSKGTYIRALARDIGERLGCGGYLKELRRSSIGSYNVINALKINEIIKLHEHFSFI
ncbi:MAG: tRNA pseudouridine55 synthase [Bacteroidota bacterium]|nr:tRNA pseudouridine55 synthase [Bacteroidota bacterium]